MDFNGVFSDHILADQLHKINLSFLASDMKKTQGGTAGNIAYNLGLLKCNPILLSVFGKEAEEYRKFLESIGVDVSSAPLSKKYFSSQAFILTDKNDNQITSFYPGSMIENTNLRINLPAMLRIARRAGELMNLGKTKKKNVETQHVASHEKEFSVKSDVKKSAYDLRQGETFHETSLQNNYIVVISPNIPEAMNGFAHQCVENKIPYMYDPGMQLPRISDEELRYGIKNCEILIGNDYEIELMKKRMGELQVPILITTLGDKGAIIFDNRNQHIINPSKPKSVVDPTGAGDSFRAGFLAGLVRDFDLKTCGQMGALNAVYTVEKYGTTTHEFNVVEFAKRYEENYGEELEL